MDTICKIFVHSELENEVKNVINSITDSYFDSEDFERRVIRYPFVQIIHTNRIAPSDSRIVIVTSNDDGCYDNICRALCKANFSICNLSIFAYTGNTKKYSQLSAYLKDIYFGHNGIELFGNADIKNGDTKLEMSIYIPEIKFDIEKYLKGIGA